MTVLAVAPDVTDDRADILDGALAAFLDFGVRRTNMAEIARRSGISPATLYRRYSQKSDVVAAVCLREAQRGLDRLEDAIDTSAPPLEQLTQLHLAVSDQLRTNELLQRVLDTDSETVLPKLTVTAEPILAMGRAYLATFLTRLQAEGHLPAYDVEPVANALARLAHSEMLTPSAETLTPDETRTFVRDHLAPFIRLSPEGARS